SPLRKTEPPIWSRLPSPPTRLLPTPVELSSVISAGSTLVLGHTLYTIDRLRFEQRLDAVEWWSRPVARDYLRLWLTSETGGLQALVYVDRHSRPRLRHPPPRPPPSSKPSATNKPDECMGCHIAA